MAYGYIKSNEQEAFERAKVCFEKAIEVGYDAYGELGELYLFGYVFDGEKNFIDKSTELLKKTSDEVKVKRFKPMADTLLEFSNDSENLRLRLMMFNSLYAGRPGRDEKIEWERFVSRMQLHNISL